MSKKDDLRRQRAGSIINLRSSKQEKRLGDALEAVVRKLTDEHKVLLTHDREWKLLDIVGRLRLHFPGVPFHYHFDKSAMRPDGGILSLKASDGALYPILIVEVKNQGTNDLRALEGKPAQSKGNAIERLGKNVIGFRSAMLAEGILPFVCFGDGCDFAQASSILDRVVTINMFGPLNQVQVVNLGDGALFNRGSFFFRSEAWTSEEMSEIMYDVAQRSLFYYFAKYGKPRFDAAGSK